MDQFGLPPAEWQHLTHASPELSRRLSRVDADGPVGGDTARAPVVPHDSAADGVPAPAEFFERAARALPG